ncbi:MAG: aminopeptidase N, partial [Bdellovibrionales bacterium]|nr:aminopeptidase N [Bdellovibrionales bacterium]
MARTSVFSSSCPLGFLACGLAALGLTLGACDRRPSVKTRPDVEGLSKEEALYRSERVSDVRYELSFELERTSTEAGATPVFGGKAVVRFKLKAPAEGLTLDFVGGTQAAAVVNGTPLGEETYNGKFIALPAQALKVGENEAAVEFTHPYSSSGAGLYRFVDPEDKRVYVYTDFEPFDANQLFPCFDQPDLKATYLAEVSAPASWTVVSASRETEATDLPAVEGQKGEARKLWKFPVTSRFSTYIFPLHAGPYKIWTADEPATGTVEGETIPLRLFARQSLARYVRPDDWFPATRQGFAFFQEYFASPYPFGKYDQLIVPDFNSGAMENVAAVTFSERYVKRGVPTRDDREGLAEVILHEMAHMWFGNLVTMKWWDDLWLNESFATFMAYLAAAEATEFTDIWQGFFDDTKQWAYWEDQLVTTHPIVAEVPDTSQAFANFDGITYGKGASALKQLSFLLSPPKFRDGVRAYMKKHAFQNTAMSDFMDSLSAASGTPLSGWTQSWLRTAGVNTISVDHACEGGKITRFLLTQSAP